LTRGELQNIAATLREAAGGRITAGAAWGKVSIASDLAAAGPVLDLPAAPFRGIGACSPLILCAALIKPGEDGVEAPEPGAPDSGGAYEAEHPGRALFAVKDLLPFSFRAAAVANMILSPLGSGEEGYSFTWKTGEPHWLPRPEKQSRISASGKEAGGDSAGTGR
jgi:hypothetical protein